MDVFSNIEKLKNKTGLALAYALGSLSKRNYSEQELADRWLEALRKDKGFYEGGWYDPPPQGVITLFGKEEDHYQRICQSSFRPPEMWPRADQIWTPEMITATYASPVQKETNLIGDFGLTLYSGNNNQLWTHLEEILLTTLHIAKNTEVGMPLCDLYKSAMRFCIKQGFENDIESPTDKTGTNIGHTIPLSYDSDSTHTVIKSAESFGHIKEALRMGRKFINSEEAQIIQPDFAFTIEPRLSTATMPNAWFHLTVIFERGRQRICHGFGPVFQVAGMERLSRLLTV